MRQLTALLTATAAVVLAGATPAEAHAGGPPPSNWVAVVDSIDDGHPDWAEVIRADLAEQRRRGAWGGRS